jgi:C_GCAxxG_C_C family probable redox protein
VYHKQLADDRVNSAIKEGLESQRVARALNFRSERTGVLRWLFVKLLASKMKKDDKPFIPSLQQRKLSPSLESLDQKVSEYLELCGNCAQTSFLTLQEGFGLDDGGAILKGLTPFPGIALRGETCGAVTGSLMALGLVYGRGREKLSDFRSYQRSLPSARRFCRRFEEEMGSTMCADIIEAEFGKRYDLANPVQAKEWMNNGAVEKCGAVISKSVHIAADIIGVYS